MAIEGFLRYVVALAIVLGSFLASYLVSFMLNLINHFASKTATSLDDEIIKSFKLPAKIFFLLIGIFGANYYLDPDLNINNYPVIEIYKIFMILFVAFILNRVISVILSWYGKSVSPKSKDKKVHDSLFPFVRKLVAWMIFLIAGMIILERMGIKIGPLLAGLGVAGLAVALALQDTLSNFFAGVSLLSDKPIKVGDYIRVEGLGSSSDAPLIGFVREIGWRTTRIETTPPNTENSAGYTIVIPNSKIAQTTVINYSQPNEESIITVNIGVNYDTDSELVKNLLKQAVKNVSKGDKHIKKEFEPDVIFKSFNPSYLEYMVLCRIDSFSNNIAASSEIREEIFKLFKKNKIEISFPTTAIQLKK